jgi:regulator of protease activity HflC (stomatin/prohibitin superfamily)
MAARTSMANYNSGFNWAKFIGQAFYLLFGLLIVFLLFKLSSWNWGVLGLFVVVFGYILFFLDSELRRLALFLLLIMYLSVDFSTGLYRLLTTNTQVMAAIRESGSLAFLLGGPVDRLAWSILLGFVGALLVTFVPLFIIASVSALFVLGLHNMDGISWWDATVNLMLLILGINVPYVLIENGQAMMTKEASKLGVMAGLGQLLIKQGNVVVLERGGKITRIVNAGTVNLRPLETIRNIFALNVHSSPAETTRIEHVLTKDRIPLTITAKITFQLEPASEADKRIESRIAPTGEGLTPKLDDGLYQVYEGTVRKAAMMSQRIEYPDTLIRITKCEETICRDIQVTKWQNIAGSAPEGEIRDHIMSHRFDELFELDNSAPGEKPAARVNKRKIYEIEDAILNDIKPRKIAVFGVLVRGVDILKIEFHKDAEHLLLNRWGAPWRQEIDLIGVETKVHGGLLEAQKDVEITDFRTQALIMLARAEIQKRQLESQGRVDIAELEGRAELTTAELKAQKIVIEARAKAQAKILEGQGEAEARAAFFREVLREIRREDVLGDDEMVAAVLRQLISTMVSVQDLQTFIKATAFMTQPPRTPLGAGLEGVNITNVDIISE